MSPTIITASTPWARNHSKVWISVAVSWSLAKPVPVDPSRTWTSLTTPNVTFGLPFVNVPACALNIRHPPNAPKDASPPMNHLREILVLIEYYLLVVLRMLLNACVV